MLSRWILLLRRIWPRETRFKHNLIRNALIVLLLVSLTPILLVGILNYFRSRDMLNKQASRQLVSVAQREVNQLKQFVEPRNRVIERLAIDSNFKDDLFILTSAQNGSAEYTQASASIEHFINTSVQIIPDYFFDQVFILKPDGNLLMASDKNWLKTNFGGEKIQLKAIRDLIGKSQSIFIFNPVSGYNNQMVLLISRSFVDEKGQPVATLFTTKSIDLAALAGTNSGLADVKSYFYTEQAGIIGISGNQLLQVPENSQLSSAVKTYGNQSQATHNHFSTQSSDGPVMAYSTWLTANSIGVMVTVDERSIGQYNTFASPITFAVLALSFIICGFILFIGSAHLIKPLSDLAQTAERFSKGSWAERVVINRNDEIGHLASSFNHMADELTELYHSLETVVARRTGQLRIASEVAQMATSTTKLSDALGRTAELIAERFGFYHVAIYLFDETGQNLVLQEASGVSGQQIKKRGDQIEINQNTLISWVAINNKFKIISNITDDVLFHADELLPDTQSETAIPITIGTEVLGVLDIQSTLTNAFDEETVAVFQTLANQISSTLQATRLLESTQLSYQETSILYRATRQVIQAHQESEIIQNLSDALIQLPFISAILSIENENFKILVVTDSKTGRVEKSLQTLSIPIGRMAELLTVNRTELIEDISQPSDYENLVSFLLRRGCKSAALVSILENGRISKVLALGSREVNRITQANLQPYANLAEVVGASLEKYRVLSALQKRLSELQTLASFSQAISAETDLTNLYRVLHEQVIQTLGADLEFAVAIYNEHENLIEWPYYYENKQLTSYPPDKLGEGLTSTLIQSRHPLLLRTELEVNAQSPLIEGRPPKTWMGIPLIFASKVVGALLIQDLDHENAFTQDDLNLFMTLAPQIATNIRNTQLYTETQKALHAYDQERFMFNTLLDNIPEGISIKDTHGRYIRASESIAQIFSLLAEEIVGKTDFDLLDRASAEKVFREEQRVMNIGKPEIGMVQHLVSPSGKEAWTHTSRIPIRTASGDPYGMLLIQRDITELKLAEALAQRRADQVFIAAEIARDATGTLDVKTLLQKSVNLVRDRFGFYHASIFLLDAIGENAVLRESTGPAGEKMMQSGHRLAVGSRSIVGQVTATGSPMIVNDVTIDPTHLPNPLLPETHSELAIPLKVGQRVLGALDVQSTQLSAFNTEDVGVLQILADQMAVAVVNGELFAKTQELLGKHRLLRQISIAASTSTSMEDVMINIVSGLRTAMVSDRIAVLMLNDESILQVEASAGYEGTRHLEIRISQGQGICGRAAVEKRPVRIDDVLADTNYINIDPDVRSELAIPILFSDELIGILNLESTQLHAFDENDQEILGALGNNLGGVIANIRLVNQVRQQVTRERQLYDVTSKIRYSVDMETILETSAKELARALGARRASIRITTGSSALPGPLDENQLPKNGGSNGKSSDTGDRKNGR
jgi:PAS domain S-box-containing protein